MRPISRSLAVSARRLSDSIGRLVKIEIRFLKYLKVVKNARSFSISPPYTPAGASLPQCAESGCPGQSGHVSPAAASQTVMTKSMLGAFGAVKTSQLLEKKLAVGYPKLASTFSANGLTTPLGMLPAEKA